MKLELDESRYHRQTLLGWWDQERVRGARFLVVGAGAIGNEVLKLLALMGAGRTLIYDFDLIERSNLSRAVLFRDADEGQGKAEVAARRMRELNPDVRALGRAENVSTLGGLGVFLWAEVIIGAVDNREARVFVNSAAARAGRPWVDGAIEGLAGVARVFDPARGPCYECTMNAVDRRLLAERRSCALLARAAAAAGRVPSTAIAASIVAALEVQEAMKLLHGQPALAGEGLHIDGLHGEVSRVAYPRIEDCPGHERLPEIRRLDAGAAALTAGALLERARADLGGAAVLDLSRDVVLALACPGCGERTPGRAALGALGERDAACPRCGAHRAVELCTQITAEAGAETLGRTLADLGVPAYDVVVARGVDPAGDRPDAEIAYLLAGDEADILQTLLDDRRPRAGEQP